MVVSHACAMFYADIEWKIAWHMGHPLSQTLFTSLYIDRLLWPDPKTLEETRFDREGHDSRGGPLLHLVLRVYCLLSITTCDFVHRRICSEHCYEVSMLLSWLAFLETMGALTDIRPGGRLRDTAI